MSPATKIALANSVMLALAIGAAFSIAFERHGVRVGRWRLLVPGALAALSDALLIAYPELRDLFQLELWTVNAVALALGVARGAFLPMFTDHIHGWVQLRRAIDGIVVAFAFAVFAAIQTGVELHAGGDTRLEPFMEFVMTLSAGFLFGRSVAAWVRAAVIQHDDLDIPL
jgi:hypothetical protein